MSVSVKHLSEGSSPSYPTNAGVAKLVNATGLDPESWGFDSLRPYYAPMVKMVRHAGFKPQWAVMLMSVRLRLGAHFEFCYLC